MLGDHTHASSGQGGQLNPNTALNPHPQVDFGDGSDGDHTAVADLLTRDMSYNNLTVTGFIKVNRFKIKVKGILRQEIAGQIYAHSGAGAAGAAGVGGAGAIAGGVRLAEKCSPTPGAKGADAGVSGAIPSVGGIAPDSYLENVVPGLVEGRLWAGGGGAGGGSVGDGVEAGAAPLRALVGAKGGKGGDAVRMAGNHTKAGGGGGVGGELIEIWANEFDNGGYIHAFGGDGGAGEGDANAQAGGGGGGGGGAILLFYRKLSGAGLGTWGAVDGGAAGASFGGAADGVAGAPGYAYAMKIGT